MQAINITVPARRYLARRSAHYSRKGRLPRLILLERTCSGARFGLFFDRPAPGDAHLDCEGITFVAEQELLDRYEGFDLDLESFFFARRILVKPRRDSRQCDCDTKCNRYNEVT